MLPSATAYPSATNWMIPFGSGTAWVPPPLPPMPVWNMGDINNDIREQQARMDVVANEAVKMAEVKKAKEEAEVRQHLENEEKRMAETKANIESQTRGWKAEIEKNIQATIEAQKQQQERCRKMFWN